MRRILLTRDPVVQPPQEEYLIKQHGLYSPSYQSNWATLQNGKYYPRPDWKNLTYQNVTGENVKHDYQNVSAPILISGLRQRVHWNSSFGSLATCLYHFYNCEDITIDDCAVIQADADYRAAPAFYFQNCGKITIRNCYLAGSEQWYHIWIEGCTDNFIHNVEIAGVQYPGYTGYRMGGGIFLSGGEPGKGFDFTKYSHQVNWSVIQNCYLHDDTYTPWPGGVQDGINFTSPGNSALFNNYVENRIAILTSIQPNHRRYDDLYTNKHIRVERNVVDSNLFFNTSGGHGGPTNSVTICNNIIRDTLHIDYHDGYHYYWRHNTFVSTPARGNNNNNAALGYHQDWSIRNGNTYYLNNLYNAYDAGPQRVHYDNTVSMVWPDYNTYLFNTPTVHWSPSWTTWAAWQGSGRDVHGVWLPAQNPFVDRVGRDFRLVAGSAPIGKGTPSVQSGEVYRRVEKDFLGKPYSTTAPACGAFEF